MEKLVDAKLHNHKISIVYIQWHHSLDHNKNLTEIEYTLSFTPKYSRFWHSLHPSQLN